MTVIGNLYFESGPAQPAKCVVCDLDEGYCEFCPVPEEDGFADDLLTRFLATQPSDPNHPANTDPDDDRPVITDRDPGDETTASNHTAPVVVISARSYTAHYRSYSRRQFVTRTIMGEDSFHATVERATRIAPEGFVLCGLTELV